MKRFISGCIVGGIICSAVSAIATSYIVNPNPYPVTVDGGAVDIEGYNINDSTYFKLRDIGDKVGFDVDFADDTINITTGKQTASPTSVPVEPQPAPTLAPGATPIPLNENGQPMYTVDGLEIVYVDNIAYVSKGDIRGVMNEKNVTDYTFGTDSLINKKTVKTVINNIPICPTNSQLIEHEFYLTVLLPFIDSQAE